MRFRQAFAATLSGFEQSLLEDMPPTPYRDFQLWAFQSQARDTWWQILGLPQFAKLTVGLFAGMLSDAQWEQLLPYASVMNRYLIYEAMTDNFANFLQTDSKNTPSTRPFQIHAVSRLNDTMIARLESDAIATTDLLGTAKSAVGKLSCFGTSITEDEQADFAERYLMQQRGVSMHDLEYGGWGLLVANVETCIGVAQALEGTRLGNFLREGLSWRYQAVNQMLYSLDMPLPERVEVGAYSVLVMPFLTYYISVLNEIILPNANLDALFEDARLEKALYKAALLVRLSNDVGTDLLMSDECHPELLDMLAHAPQKLVNEVLLDLSADVPYLTRFQKDIAFGEYNTCLYDVGASTNTSRTRTRFEHNLTYLGHIYRANREQLLGELRELSDVMGSDLTSKLIWRFVEFHEKLYSAPYQSQAGEYATTPNA
jgi:hypothetical protein